MAWLRRGYRYSLEEYGPTHPRTSEMRAYLCKGLMEYGDLDAALAECGAAREEVLKAKEDSARNLLGRIDIYIGSTLRLLHRYAEAKKELERAKVEAAPGDDPLSELALVESALGDDGAALAYLKSALAEAEKEFPPEHANVIMSQMSLAQVALQGGAVADARARLDRAIATAARAELSPLVRAELEFAAARAIWRTDPGSAAKAILLAESARASLAAHAPATVRYQSDLHHVEKWLRDPAVRSLPYAVMDPSARETWGGT